MQEHEHEPDHTAVIPYVAVEADPEAVGDAASDAARTKLVVEAKLTWAGSLLAVTHTKPRSSLGAAVRVRDLDLSVSAPDVDLVVAKQVDGGMVLVLPNGEIVPPGCRMSLRLGRLLLRLALVPADVESIPRSKSDRRVAKGVLLGAVIHAAILACAILGRAPIGDQEARAQSAMSGYLAAIDERSAREAAESVSPEAGGSIDNGQNMKDEKAASHAKKREAGLAGNPTRVNEGGVAMKATGDQRHGQSERARPETFGMIALLGGEKSNGANTSRSAFGDFEGPAAMGSIFGTRPEDSAGNGGLGLSGVGEGGGGNGAGVPLSGLGTLGFGGGGSCDAACMARLGLGNIGTIGHAGGYGNSHCRDCNRGAHHPTWRFSMSDGYAMVNGRLPPEAIQRIVRQNFGRLRGCYESGLQRNPSLEGRVAVKFVIDREGAVSMVSVAESSLGDSQVEACIARAYNTMSFPKPEGGIITVVYPITFNNGS